MKSGVIQHNSANESISTFAGEYFQLTESCFESDVAAQGIIRPIEIPSELDEFVFTHTHTPPPPPPHTHKHIHSNPESSISEFEQSVLSELVQNFGEAVERLGRKI